MFLFVRVYFDLVAQFRKKATAGLIALPLISLLHLEVHRQVWLTQKEGKILWQLRDRCDLNFIDYNEITRQRLAALDKVGLNFENISCDSKSNEAGHKNKHNQNFYV